MHKAEHLCWLIQMILSYVFYEHEINILFFYITVFENIAML